MAHTARVRFTRNLPTDRQRRFLRQGGTKAAFDRQPLEARTMASACRAAWRTAADPVWQREARRACEWFPEHNDPGLPPCGSRLARSAAGRFFLSLLGGAIVTFRA